MRVQVFMLLSLCAFAANATIYRCEDKGRVLFQDKPCAGADSGENQVKIDARFLRSAEPASAPASCTRPSTQQIQDAQESVTVIACMNKKEVLDAARPGKEYNARTGSDERGAYEVWFFSDTQASFPPRVTFRNGLVESFGNDDNFGMTKPAALGPKPVPESSL